MISEHRWNCKKCDLKWYLSVNDIFEHEREKLAQFERAVSNHIFITQHEVTHEEKLPFKIKYK